MTFSRASCVGSLGGLGTICIFLVDQAGLVVYRFSNSWVSGPGK